MYPLVSICTPTYNRRPFISAMIRCFEHQDYPKDRMEWIILDDGTDPIGDLVQHIPQVKYYKQSNKLCLGEKRNLMHTYATGDFIVYMDDDDYYPPERVSHAVDMLQRHPEAMCAGSSILYIYYKHIDQIYQFGPYGANHATAGTFAFRKELLRDTAYDNSKAFGEEKSFLKNYTVPFVQLDPSKVILVFAHAHNTYDKHLLLSPTVNTVRQPTSKKVTEFIQDKELMHFYTNQMHSAILAYYPGHPSMKPDVASQLEQKQLTIRIGDRFLTGDDIIAHINHQQRYIQILTEKLKQKNS